MPAGSATEITGRRRCFRPLMLVDASADPDAQPDDDRPGSNAWPANRRDQRSYGGGIVSKIDRLLADNGAAAENYEMPEHVQASRRNLGRSTVVSVRLSARNTASSGTRPRRRTCRSPR